MSKQSCARILLDNEQIAPYRRAGVAKKMDLTRAISKFKTIVTECKKTKVCPHCSYPAGKVKKMPGNPTKVYYAPMQ